MNPNLEAIIRATGVFISVFFTTRWTSKSAPAYDLPLVIFAIITAFSLNHVGPFKVKQ